MICLKSNLPSKTFHFAFGAEILRSERRINDATATWRASKTRKSESQIKVQGNTKEDHVTFVKNHASNCAKIRSRRIFNVEGRFLPFGTYWTFLIFLYFVESLHFYHWFILTVAIVIELTFVLFQQPRHCLWEYSRGDHKSRGFCYPVTTLPSLKKLLKF